MVVQVLEAGSVHDHPIVDPADRRGRQAAGKLVDVHLEAVGRQLGWEDHWLVGLSVEQDVL